LKEGRKEGRKDGWIYREKGSPVLVGVGLGVVEAAQIKMVWWCGGFGMEEQYSSL
jgi:hypothetical protein